MLARKFTNNRLHMTGVTQNKQKILIKAGFQHAYFSASAEFFACADFSAYPQSNFHHNADCFKIQILKDLDKSKITNI